MTAHKTKTAKPSAQPVPESPSPAPQAKGKIGILVSLMRRPEGATLFEMAEATGWQFHSIRGAMAGAIKKRLALEVVSEKPSNERIYRIKAGASDEAQVSQ